MKSLAVMIFSLIFVVPLAAQVKQINGAGASFPYPVYSQWAHAYHNAKGVQVNYQSIGSGGGIAQIRAKTVNFGGTDIPMKEEELNEAGLIQFPTVMGGVVPIFNVKGIKPGEMRLTPEVLTDIFLGKIRTWNDPKIRKLNPSLKLPKTKITAVRRSDGSGTTWIFTNYLSKVSKEWEKKVGNASAVQWPVGVGGKGNEGVAAYVGRINGSIGYVEFAYALTNNLSYVQLRNREGAYVRPTIESFQSAAANADWNNAPGFYMVLTDQPGKDSWPITGATYILMHKDQPDTATASAVLDFFDWCYKNGNDSAIKLHYVPMPESVIKAVHDHWKNNIKVSGKGVWK